MTKLKFRITFTDDLLGTCSGNADIHREFIASKAPDAQKIEDEVAALGVDGVEEKTMTIFPKLPDGTPFLWDYQIRGFFKEVFSAMRCSEVSRSNFIKSYKI